jgi:hypothetical protein
MASTAQEIVELLDPSKVGDSRLTSMLSFAEECLDEATWQTDYQKAIAYLTLHLYAMGARAGSTAAGGPITAEAEGALSRSYQASAREDTWALTSWGQMLLDLQRKWTGSIASRMTL